jgi:eukaryotic-like serine/threonine-protein kinase
MEGSTALTSVDPGLIADACTALGVSDVREIGAPGGQKAVRQVDRNGTDLVMKVVALRASSPTTLQRAEREVELLQSLTSDHVVRVESELVTIGSPPRGAAWLEEFLDGDDLQAHLGSRWTWGDTAEFGYQVADGLAAAHAAGVIHRDLSPHNVRRLSSGTYKVMDFGFARHTLRTGLTIAGQPGTPGFLSPEHLNAYSGGPMPASDVFGVGILMYAALTGEWPIPYNGDDGDYVRRLGRVEITDIGIKRPDLTDQQLAVVRRMLHPQPARRFLNGKRLADALEPLR